MAVRRMTPQNPQRKKIAASVLTWATTMGNRKTHS